MPSTIARDARIGLRLLWKSRGFTAVAILTLALGIGSTTLHARSAEPRLPLAARHGTPQGRRHAGAGERQHGRREPKHPRDHPASASGWSASVEPFRNNFLSDDTKRGLWLLLGAVGFLLLIACANVANLLLARGTARRRELAVRASLGASRAQIIGQLLVESLVLALIGVALAAGLLAGGSTDASVHASDRGRRPPQRSGAAVHAGGLRDRGHALRLGARLAAARADVNDTLKESGRSLSGGGNRLRHALVVVEFALALALLTGGGLAIHSLFTLANRDLGFRTEGLLTFSLSVAEDRFESPEEIAAFYRQVVEHLEAVPGVLSASVSTGMPVRGVNIGMQFDRATRPEPDVGKRPGAGFNMVTPEYFETFGIRLTRGRAFTDQDRAWRRPRCHRERDVRPPVPG